MRQLTRQLAVIIILLIVDVGSMSAGVVNNLDLDLLQTFFHSLANYFVGERLHMTIIPMIVMIFLVVDESYVGLDDANNNEEDIETSADRISGGIIVKEPDLWGCP